MKAQPAATRTPEAEHHPEHVGFVIEKVSFLVCFGHLKGGVRETRSLEPILIGWRPSTRWPSPMNVQSALCTVKPALFDVQGALCTSAPRWGANEREARVGTNICIEMNQFA